MTDKLFTLYLGSHLDRDSLSLDLTETYADGTVYHYYVPYRQADCRVRVTGDQLLLLDKGIHYVLAHKVDLRGEVIGIVPVFKSAAGVREFASDLVKGCGDL